MLATLAGLCQRRPLSAGAVWACTLALVILANLALHWPVLWIGVSIVSCGWVLVRMPTVFQFHPRRFLRRSPRPVASWDRAVATFLLLAQGIAIIQLVIFAGIPLVNYDVLSYHIPLAERFAHALTMPTTFYGRLPLGASIIQALVVGDGGANAAWQISIILCVIAGASCVARIAALLGGRHVARALAATIYLFHPMAIDCVKQGLVDPITAMLAVAAVEMLLRGYSRSGTWYDLLLCGVLLGSSFSTKYSAAGMIVVPILLVAVVYTYRRVTQSGARAAVVPLAAMATGVAAAAGPWLVRAFVIGGSIAHPFRGFAESWTSTQALFVVAAHQPQTPMVAGWWIDAMRKAGTFGYALPFFGTSALLLLALLVFRPNGSRAARVLLVAVILGYAAWLCVRLNPARFLFPVVGVLIPISVVAMSSACSKICARAATVLLLLGIAFTEVQPAREAVSFDPVYTTRMRASLLDAYLGEPLMRVVKEANGAQNSGRLLLVFEARAALFHGDVVGASVWDQPPYAVALKSSTTVSDFARNLRGAGFDRIFVNEFEWGRLLDFYAGGQFQKNQTQRGRVGLTAKLSDSEMTRAFSAYPPHMFAGLTKTQLQILRDFLLACRRNAVIVSPAGTGAEIWYAHIPEEFQ